MNGKYVIQHAASSQFHWNLKAGNGEPIGTSEMCSSEAARDKGNASCKENGPSRVTQDDTK